MIVFSKNEEEHQKHLAIVFEELQRHKLLANPEFFMLEIHFLGHIVSKEGVRMDPAKIEVVRSWLTPRNLHEVRRFLVPCSYYHGFIFRLAEIAFSIHALQRKGTLFVWIEGGDKAFATLKEKLPQAQS